MTLQHMIESLREEVTPDGRIILDKLEEELRLFFWPTAVFDLCVEVFGSAMNNPKSRHRLSLDRRIRHALSVWNTKYGPLSPAQSQYASDVIVYAIKSGHSDWLALGKPDVPPVIAMCLSRLSDVVNHERVHEGFKTRDGRESRDVSFLRQPTTGNDPEEAA